MFIHRENALKAHQHISYCSNFYTKDHFKQTILIQNLIKIFTKTHQIAHFFKIFLRDNMPPNMCAADIIISIWKEPFIYSECNQINIH